MPRKVAPKRQRSPGRPKANVGDLRTHLIDVSIGLFSTQGIEATPLRTIAKTGGVTPALLHYYFGSKAQLVEAMIAERLLPIVGDMRATLATAKPDSASLIDKFVDTVFGLIERHPWFPSLWVREVLSEGGVLRDLIVTRIAPQVPRQLETIFREAQKSGQINRDLDPRLLVVSLLGSTLFLAASAPIWRRIFRADDIDTEVLRKHTRALLRAGIRNT
jgi:TetR/AcrR family transcriptional regulator